MADAWTRLADDRMTGMKFLRRTSWAVIISGSVVSFALWGRWGSPAAIAFITGWVWALANFWVLAFIVRALTDRDGPRHAQAVLFGLAKLSLYGVGAAILAFGKFPPLFLVAGFTWLMIVVLLRAAGAKWAGPKSS